MSSTTNCHITMPMGYKVVDWKVRHGSPVRQGETVAVVVREEAAAVANASSATAATSSSTTGDEPRKIMAKPAAPTTTQHKRPTRRKRPVPSALASNTLAERTTSTSAAAAAAAAAASSSGGTSNNAAIAVATGWTAKKSTEPSAPTSSSNGSSNELPTAATLQTNPKKGIPRTVIVAQTAPAIPTAASLSVSNSNSNSNQLAITAQADGIVRVSGITSNASKNKPDGDHDDSNGVVIGYIEPCQHPTVIGGLCAVCGNKPNRRDNAEIDGEQDNFANLNASVQNEPDNNNGQSRMSRMTISGLTVTVSEAEGQRLAEQDAARLQKLGKLSLILDLDHTLVHATADPRAQKFCKDNVRSLVLPVYYQPQQQQQQQQQAPLQHRPVFHQHFVKLRPYVKEFLESVLDTYEIGVYTAGTREYAEQIVILLARHLVGSKYDQVELDSLRRQVAQKQAEFQKHQQQLVMEATSGDTNTSEPTGINGTTNPTENGVATAVSGKGEASTDDKEGNSIDRKVAAEGDKAAAGRKRKRVTFGDAPSSVKSDQVTKEDVEKLQAELADAERLERTAIELRQKLFGSRVVSRTEVGDLGRDVKSLKRIFPCGGEMAAVVDDREDVWANAQDIKSTRPGEPPENLLLVRPYHWSSFVGFADVNNASGVDLSGGDQNPTGVTETDEQLVWTAEILKKLHQRYYSSSSAEQPTVPQILEQMRREVLSGCRLVLSGLVPLHKQDPNPLQPRHPFIRYAQNLGAALTPTVDESITHIVASKDGTEKILSARRIPGCHILKPSWLMECVWSFSRRDERSHILGPPTIRTDRNRVGMDTKDSVQPLADSTRDNSSSSSSDEEDDDFVKSLENEMREEAGSE